jgi:hypothetical protein
MHRKKLTDPMVRVLKFLYEEQTFKVKIKGSIFFEVTNGTMQCLVLVLVSVDFDDIPV